MLLLLGVLLAAAPGWAQFVAPGGTIPVVANLPGMEGTFWRSDLSVLNVGSSDTTISMQLYPEIVNGQPVFQAMAADPISLPAGQQLVLTNIVQSKFGLLNVKGALRVFSTDGTPLVLASRTYTFGKEGSYGQDVSSVLVAGSAWAAGLEHDSLYRTNIGIFWPWDETVQFTVQVFANDNSQAGSGQVSFSQAGLQQKSFSAFGVSNLTGGYVVITCSDSQAVWYAYVTTVDQSSGDAVYRPAQSYQVGAQ